MFKVKSQHLVFVYFILAMNTTSYAEKLLLNSGHSPPLSTNESDGFHDLIAKEAYRRVGIDITIHRLPHERASKNANSGIDDGNGPRIEKYINHFPNLRMIPEKIIDFNFVGFTTTPSITPKNWKELENLNVGIVTGWKVFEVNVKKSMSLTKTSNIQQLFNLLKHGRVDIVLIEKWQGLYAAKTLGMSDFYITTPPFAKKSMYFHLHKKHENLVGKVAKALKDMKSDGTYKRLYDEKLLPLLPK